MACCGRSVVLASVKVRLDRRPVLVRRDRACRARATEIQAPY